jgi:hypothetical protein
MTATTATGRRAATAIDKYRSYTSSRTAASTARITPIGRSVIPPIKGRTTSATVTTQLASDTQFCTTKINYNSAN